MRFSIRSASKVLSTVYRNAIFWAAPAVFLLVIGTQISTQLFTNAYEDLSIGLFPSAERYYDIGERHFTSRNPAAYDINRAEHFFRQAADRDFSLPYVYHQLARISFLRGDFPRALAQINAQISMHGDKTPSSYYVRGLILGYMGSYEAAAIDYKKYLESDPNNWAGVNDYAWVLLKAERFSEAAEAIERGLVYFPNNAWLLNSSAIALFEMGEFEKAFERAKAAVESAALVTEQEWLVAYPGNDPKIAALGIQTLRRSASENMHRIGNVLTRAGVQPR